MKIKCKATDLHTAIDAEWQRKQKEEMKERDVNCTVCNRSDCEPAAHATWTEFDAERGVWIERTSEEFFGDSIAKLNDLADKDTCPECEGHLSDAGRCWNCTASDYQEEEER